MARRKAKRKSTKIQPSVRTLTFPIGNIGTNTSRYIDLSQASSLVNRRFYRQGINWAVAGFTLHISPVFKIESGVLFRRDASSLEHNRFLSTLHTLQVRSLQVISNTRRTGISNCRINCICCNYEYSFFFLLRIIRVNPTRWGFKTHFCIRGTESNPSPLSVLFYSPI